MRTMSDWSEADLKRYIANLTKAQPAGLPRSLKLQELEVVGRLIIADKVEASPQARAVLRAPDDPGTYAATNVTPDRAYDADSTTVAELADVLGTLLADLRAAGIIN